MKKYAKEQVNRNNNQLLSTELTGWAAVKSEGLDKVTGGGNAIPQIVTTLNEFKRLVKDDIPRVIIVLGIIECVAYGVLVGSNKTIIGADDKATINGGIRIHNASNVIVYNLKIHGTWPESGPDDCIEIKNSHHVWLNHLNIWNSTDGNLDIIIGSDFITVSWCKFWYSSAAKKHHKHRLNCLVGSGAGDHDDTDLGKLHVTFHHNWFGNGCSARMPRVMYGKAHIYNNYYDCKDNEYCIGADCYASLLVENNYFDGVNSPHIFMYPNNPQPACIIARGNIYDNTIGRLEEGQKRPDMKVQEFEFCKYNYWLNKSEDVPSLIKSYAGPINLETVNYDRGEFVKGKGERIELVKKYNIFNETHKRTNSIINDNPILFDGIDTFKYQGQNSDDSNAFYRIKNPFKNIDFTEDPEYIDGKPHWKNGATIAFWVNIPENATDATILNFNIENDVQIERSDLLKHKLCKGYRADNSSYNMGEVKIFIDEYGTEYIGLDGYGENVRYNPNYPKDGCYYISYDGGSHYVYEKGTDGSEWFYINHIGVGLYEEYSARYFENNGEKSKIQETEISGSLSLYASGSVGFRQDNLTGIQMNPYLYNYKKIIAAQPYNQFYYWGNCDITGKQDFLPATIKEKNKWHFVVVTIKNDWIQYYVDGEKLTREYLNWWGKPINRNAAGESFNLGYGHPIEYRNDGPSEIFKNGKLLLEFISDEKCELLIGGTGLSAAKLGQCNIGTPKGVMVRDLRFYSIPINERSIKYDSIEF